MDCCTVGNNVDRSSRICVYFRIIWKALFIAQTPSCPAYYFTCGTQAPQDQPIYGYFNFVSKSLNDCVEADLLSLPEDIESSEYLCSLLADRELFIYGFLYYLLLQPTGLSENAPIKSMVHKRCGRDVKDVINDKYNQLAPLIILDEFQTTSQKTNDRSMRFLRNSIRAVGFRLAVTGTDSAAANMVNAGSRGRHSDRPWCRIIFRLPPFIAPLAIKNNILRQILLSSRPLFSKLALDYTKEENILPIKDAVELQALAQYVGRKAIAFKRLALTKGGRHGQVAMFLSASFLNARTALLVHEHFAVFDTCQDSLDVDSDMNVIKSSAVEKWEPWQRLPSPKEDLLLHLSLSGIPGVPCLFHSESNTDEEVSFNSAAKYLLSLIESNQYRLLYSNMASNDGLHLEAFIVAACCKASHSQGFSGCPIPKFIEQFFFELTGKQNIHFDESLMDRQLNFLKDFKVPFMSPPNTEWPKFLGDLKGAVFGDLSRTSTKTRVDFLCIPQCISGKAVKLSGECKDYKRNLNVSDIQDIVDRIPSDSQIHLVITNRLPTKQCSGIKRLPSTCCFFRLSSSVGLLTSIKGLKNARNPSSLVLFVENDFDIHI